jgi:hypothetical protein
MVSIKEAVQSAVAFAQTTLGEERTKGIRLEEVETKGFSDDVWLITLSMVSADAVPLMVSMTGKGSREYKTFTVVKGTGEVTSMKIRELADA